MKKSVKRVLWIVPTAVVGVAIFVTALLGILEYSINQSDAAEAGRVYLRGNQRLKDEIGEVKDFGSLITGHLRSKPNVGQAGLSFKVYGERKTVNATVSMIAKDGRTWRVTGAEYINDQGRKIILFDPYAKDPNAPDADPSGSPAP
jgi:hypothetical protein